VIAPEIGQIALAALRHMAPERNGYELLLGELHGAGLGP
jgi:hypothetical protein